MLDEAGEPVPYVRIGVQEHPRGTLSDEQGNFHIGLAPGRYELVFQHLSYETQTIALDLPYPGLLEVRLVARDLELAQVDITAGKEDPAYAIIQQVIDNKADYLRQYDRYHCETYQKIVLLRDSTTQKTSRKDSADADTRPASPVQALVESQSTTYFQRPRQFKSIVHAYRYLQPAGGEEADADRSLRQEQAGQFRTAVDNPYLFYQDVSDADFNFYQNLIEAPTLCDQPLVSPLHSLLWRLNYRYRLEETYDHGEGIRYRIRVMPRTPTGPLFEGELIVIDKTWAIESADFTVMPASLSYFSSFQLQHIYKDAGKGRRVLVREAYNYTLREGRTTYSGSSLALHSDHVLDPDLPDNFFRNELRRTEAEAFGRDSSYWQQIRPMRLDAVETTFVRAQDSILAYRSSDAYLSKQDSIYNHLSLMDFVFNGIGFRHRKAGMEYYINPLISMFQPVGVGGYRVMAGGNITKTWPRYKALSVGGEVDYGLINGDVKGQIRLGYTYDPRRSARVRLRVGDIYSMVNANETLLGVIGGGNFVSKRYVGVGHRFEVRNGLYLDVGVDFADRQAIDSLALPLWTSEAFGDRNVARNFDPYRELVFDIRLSYTPGQRYQMEPYRKVVQGSRWPTLHLRYKKSVPGFFGSDQDFDFIEVSAEQAVQLGSLGTSRWNMAAGRYLRTNRMRFVDRTYIRGTDSYLFANPLLAFQLLGPTVSTEHEYAYGHYLHDFGGALFDRIPLIRRTALQLTVGAGSLLIHDGIVWEVTRTPDPATGAEIQTVVDKVYPVIWHSEAYAGLQYPFRVKRQRFKVGVYFVGSYSTFDQAVGAQIKVGATFYNPITRQWQY
ncbi:MAG: hypothetical protein OHK0039_31740 [Bacteroidia bacterium]